MNGLRKHIPRESSIIDAINRTRASLANKKTSVNPFLDNVTAIMARARHILPPLAVEKYIFTCSPTTGPKSHPHGVLIAQYRHRQWLSGRKNLWARNSPPSRWLAFDEPFQYIAVQYTNWFDREFFFFFFSDRSTSQHRRTEVRLENPSTGSCAAPSSAPPPPPAL